MLAETVSRLFAEVESDQLQPTIDEMGLAGLMLSEGQGGAGCGWEELFEVLEPAGQYAAAVPLGENILASQLLGKAGNFSLSPYVEGSLQEGKFSGEVRNIPWGRAVDTVVAQAATGDVFSLDTSAAHCRENHNLADEPRDTLIFDRQAIGPLESADLLQYCALMRSVQMAGALEGALQLTAAYTLERHQFGRAIGKFQAVQQQLAVFAVEVAAVSCAVRAACRAATRGDAAFQIGAAKLRANTAVEIASRTAHQVHGAIGFTREHQLRQFTQRLWSWRTEYGNDRYWSEFLGRRVIERGAEHFWSDLTARDDRVAG
ncbi:MAG: acyl-CoA dehydrogenase [Halieaceae bacterium]|jgi:acyl-CoA dehydrogenase|nr:acyl-CoA dehydrogenase [Halieaceae bacterium]